MIASVTSQVLLPGSPAFDVPRYVVEAIEGELPTVGGANADAVRIIHDTVESLVGNAEDAKGVLRGLKELTGN